MQRSLYIRQTVAILAVLTAIYACKGAGVNPDGMTPSEGGAANPAQTGNFVGRWAGKYASRDSGAALQETPARATFVASDAKTGTFRIELTQIPNAYAAGTYTIIDQTSMLLNVQHSTISTIGVAGSQSVIDYTLIGNSFELRNEQIKMEMAPDATGGTPATQPTNPTTPNDSSTNHQATPAPGGDGKTDPLTGKWSCTDKLGNQWQMSIETDLTFFIEIFDASGNRGSIYLRGSATITRAPGKPDAGLSVQNSNVAKYQGMQLQLSMHGDVDVDMLRLATKEVIPCIRS